MSCPAPQPAPPQPAIAGEGIADRPCWHAVFCKPQQESIALDNLERQHFQVYLPRLQSRKRRAGKWVETVEALFPRYLFIRVNPQQQSTAAVRSTIGAIGLVRFGVQPALVPDDIIAAIRQLEDEASGLRHDTRPLFCVDEPIRLVDGPLLGMEGIFSRQDSDGRVIVLLDLLGKANKITVQRDWIAKAA